MLNKLKDKGSFLIPIAIVLLISAGFTLEYFAPQVAKPEIEAIEKILEIEHVKIDFSQIENHDLTVD